MTWIATGTATEIAIAEAAAAAAAEAAATEAAAATAASAVTAAAPEAAAVIPEAVSSVVPEAASAAPSSILDAAGAVTPPPPAEPLPPAGIEQVAGAAPTPPAEPLPPAGQTPAPGIQTASGPATSDVGGAQANDQIVNMVKNATPDQMIPNNPLPPGYEPAPVTPPAAPTPTPTPGADAALNAPNANPTLSNPNYSGTGLNPGPSTPSPLTQPNPGGGFMEGFGQFVKDNPFLTGAGMYGIASATGMLNPSKQTFGEQNKTTFNNPYHFSPNFKGSHPNPQQWQVDYSKSPQAHYANGGITQASPPTPGLMDGGDTNNVDFMGKDMYPMSQQDNSHYATPSQMPTSAQQTMASYEPNTNPLTGEMSANNMAEGGQVPGYAFGGILSMQQLLDSIQQSGQMPTQDQYLASQGLHSSFNPDYAFDKTNARFIPMSSVTAPEAPAAAAAPTPDTGGAWGGGQMPNELNYAGGGIARYYRGDLATSTGGRGDVYGATQRFLDMYDPASRYTPPQGLPDVGIFHDTNPSTRDKSAPDAAAIRNKAIANKAGVKTGANFQAPSRAMGQLDFTPPGVKGAADESASDQVLAASGGIMGANLGGYAAGGNPRLLKGPGDGMSDNIPATIGGRQPARLADGEFVVPADVVSHLGNGSTDAGAKRLHQMMDQIRMDRTGKKKQAPAVKAEKYIPK